MPNLTQTPIPNPNLTPGLIYDPTEWETPITANHITLTANRLTAHHLAALITTNPTAALTAQEPK